MISVAGQSLIMIRSRHNLHCFYMIVLSPNIPIDRCIYNVKSKFVDASEIRSYQRCLELVSLGLWLDRFWFTSGRIVLCSSLHPREGGNWVINGCQWFCEFVCLQVHAFKVVAGYWMMSSREIHIHLSLFLYIYIHIFLHIYI